MLILLLLSMLLVLLSILLLLISMVVLIVVVVLQNISVRFYSLGFLYLQPSFVQLKDYLGYQTKL